jgi:hypothetical protein
MNNCYLCHLLHSCFLVCFLRLICIFVLFDSSVLMKKLSIRCLKIAGVSLVGHLRYFMGLSCKVNLRGESRPVLPSRDQPALFRQREGRCSRYGSAIFAHLVLGTNTFVLKTFFFTFFRSFSIEISTENIHRLQYFCLSLGKVLVNVNIINILTYIKELTSYLYSIFIRHLIFRFSPPF